MTKRDIVLKIAYSSTLKQADIMTVVQKFLDNIVEGLAEGKTVELRNFGVFKVKNRRAKKGRNPRTGEIVPVPERKTVSFKPGLVMKQKVGSKRTV